MSLGLQPGTVRGDCFLKSVDAAYRQPACLFGQGPVPGYDRLWRRSSTRMSARAMRLVAGVSCRHCVEKEEVVQLVFTTYKSDAYRNKQLASTAAGSRSSSGAAGAASSSQETEPLAGERPSPYDMTPWLHMPVFFKAEAGEVTDGRPPAVVSTYTTAALQRGDEMYGCLCCWNAVKAIKDGDRPYLLGELLRWLDAAYTCKAELGHWGGYMMVELRINVIKGMRGDIKVRGAGL